MDNFVLASQISFFNLFGWGFLTGSLFGFVMMLAFEFVGHINRASDNGKSGAEENSI
jgi:hypothetical protein